MGIEAFPFDIDGEYEPLKGRALETLHRRSTYRCVRISAAQRIECQCKYLLHIHSYRVSVLIRPRLPKALSSRTRTIFSMHLSLGLSHTHTRSLPTRTVSPSPALSPRAAHTSSPRWHPSPTLAATPSSNFTGITCAVSGLCATDYTGKHARTCEPTWRRLYCATHTYTYTRTPVHVHIHVHTLTHVHTCAFAY